MSVGLVVDELDVLVSTLFKLLLKIATTVLILAKGIDLAFKALEGNVVETRDFCGNFSRVDWIGQDGNLPPGPWWRLCTALDWLSCARPLLIGC